MVFDRITAAWRSRLLLAAPVVAALALAAWTPTDDGPTVCPFALATGQACPGCGMSRAFGYLARGDITTAVAYHPLAILIGVQAIAGWAWLLLRKNDRVQPLSARLTNAILVGTAVSLFAVWILRALSGSLPPV